MATVTGAVRGADGSWTIVRRLEREQLEGLVDAMPHRWRCMDAAEWRERYSRPAERGDVVTVWHRAWPGRRRA